MRRIQSVIAIAAMMAILVKLAAPAMAKSGVADIRNDRTELIEEHLEERGIDVGELDGEDLEWSSWGFHNNFGLWHDLD